MEEQEVSVEHLHEVVHEHAGKISWAEKVALTTALLAVLAALSSLFSTHESDKAILFKVAASDQWSYYQAKGIKGMITQDPTEKARYNAEQKKISEDAESKDHESEQAVHTHEFFSYAVTIFQIATAIGAIAVLVKKKYLWYMSLTLGAGGLALVIKAFTLLVIA
ncbi:MAG TPA: DUF4337 family protein [Blastocatellia bacterium]|nr:DUF4337 family protein [Blastocatellia bacterium]